MNAVQSSADEAGQPDEQYWYDRAMTQLELARKASAESVAAIHYTMTEAYLMRAGRFGSIDVRSHVGDTGDAMPARTSRGLTR